MFKTIKAIKIWILKKLGPEIFKSRKNLGPENLGSQKIWVAKNFASWKIILKKNWVPKKFGPKKILVPKKIWSQKIWVAKNFGSPNNSHPEETLVAKNFGPKKICVPKKFASRKFWVSKNLSCKKVMSRKNFGPKKLAGVFLKKIYRTLTQTKPNQTVKNTRECLIFVCQGCMQHFRFLGYVKVGFWVIRCAGWSTPTK